MIKSTIGYTTTATEAARSKTTGSYGPYASIHRLRGAQKADCRPTDSCPNPNRVLADVVKASPTPPPRLQTSEERKLVELKARASSSCTTTTKKKESDKDRSRNKSRLAKQLADEAKDSLDLLEEFQDITQMEVDAAIAGVAAAAAAAAAAIILSDDDDSTSGDPEAVYEQASSALSAARPLESFNNGDSDETETVNLIYSDITEAANEASSAADIASSFTTSPPKTTTSSTKTTSSTPTQTLSPPKGKC